MTGHGYLVGETFIMSLLDCGFAITKITGRFAFHGSILAKRFRTPRRCMCVYPPRHPVPSIKPTVVSPPDERRCEGGGRRCAPGGLLSLNWRPWNAGRRRYQHPGRPRPPPPPPRRHLSPLRLRIQRRSFWRR